MPKLKALVTIVHANNQNAIPGDASEVFETDDANAKYLLDNGYAELIEAAPAKSEPAAAKTGKKASKPAEDSDL